MIIDDITLIDIVRTYGLTIDERLQRNFQWEPNKDELYIEKLILSSKLIAENKNDSVALGHMGSLTCFKKEIGTNHDFFLDDGGQRTTAGILSVLISKRIIEDYGLMSDDKYEYSYVLMKNFCKNIKNSFLPHKNDEYLFNLLLDGYNIDKKKYKESRLFKAYSIIERELNGLFTKNEKDFSNFCDFLVNHFRFSMFKYDYTNLNVRRIVYEKINGIQQEHTQLSMALNSISEDAEKLGVENFSDLLLVTKSLFKETFKTSKRGSGEQKGEYELEQYIFIKLYSWFGFLTTNHENLKIYPACLYFMRMVGDNERKLFYDTLLKKDCVDLFINLYKGEVKLGLYPSEQVNVCLYIIQSIMMYFNDKNGTRKYVSSVAYNIIYNTLNFAGNEIIGVKDGFMSSMVWRSLADLHIYRFLFTSDDKTGLGKVLSECRQITDNESLCNLTLLLNEIADGVMFNENYINSTFSKVAYDSRDTKLILFTVLNHSNDLNQSLQEAANQLSNKSQFHIDHIVPRYTKESLTPIEGKVIDSIGNLRILHGSANVKQNNLPQYRYVEENAKSFPDSMKNRNFTINDISSRQKWICDVVREYNSYIYNFNFK